jgi:hypothetical protein
MNQADDDYIQDRIRQMDDSEELACVECKSERLDGKQWAHEICDRCIDEKDMKRFNDLNY